MKKLHLIIPFFRILITKPSILLKAIYHAVIKYDRKVWVSAKFKMSNGLPEIDILDLFPNLHETVDPFSNLYGTSLPIDMAILKLFSKRFIDCDYLEIGAWRGESLANVAPLVRSCTSISLSDADMKKYGWGEQFTKLQRLFSHPFQNINHIEANSREFDFLKLKKKFDLIFIDGDHSFEGVKSDTENAFKLLKDESSIIIWHDYTANYEHIDWEVFAGILAGAPHGKMNKIYHISNSLCAIYLDSQIKSHRFIYPSYPDKNFKMEIRGERI